MPGTLSYENPRLISKRVSQSGSDEDQDLDLVIFGLSDPDTFHINTIFIINI